MDRSREEIIESKLSAINSRGQGSLSANIVFVDEWWPSSYVGDSVLLFNSYIARSTLKTDQLYITCAEKRWMYSEDEWHEALAMELDLIRPRMVVALGNRRVRKILLKVKDMLPDFRWFYELRSHHVIKRFYHDDEFYIYQLNQLATDFQYDQELETDLHLKNASFLPRKR